MNINRIDGLHEVEFDKGRFDNWCVYLKRQGKSRYPPLDNEYFLFFRNMASKHGATKVYNDFVQVYNATTALYDTNVIKMIKTISLTYCLDATEVELWLSVIYGGMIAEENKANAVLKKRIKRLGMHQVLIDNIAPDIAAAFSKGKSWREINSLMKQKGFGI